MSCSTGYISLREINETTEQVCKVVPSLEVERLNRQHLHTWNVLFNCNRDTPSGKSVSMVGGEYEVEN